MNEAPLLFDATHTSHTPAQTGIQRVCRSVFVELERRGPIVPVCFDPHLGDWRQLNRTERQTLSDRSANSTAGSRGAKWTLAQKVTGHVRRMAGRREKLPPARGLLCVELFSARVGRHWSRLRERVTGPTVAVFHDAIGLKLPELTPPATVARLPGYLQELLSFDGVAAVSEDSAASLRDYWKWLGIADAPPVISLGLGWDPPPSVPKPSTSRPIVLSVGTIEGRKNHRALLDAAEQLWREGLAFDLELIGLARPATAPEASTQLQALRKSGRPVRVHGSVSEAALHEAYARCAFTVYPSLMEGFGLPVIESLGHGKPCVCSSRGALGEIARGGGCVLVDSPDANSLAAAMRSLLENSAARESLAGEARRRRFRSWADYAGALTEWMSTLRLRR
ncbi:MAG TPA: glycosyltransferase family 1 protein [Candidatus Didemnitutus sp.]|nr:glycosyltransferase family 1 protein [Candidatus Didemnitutus sp.]